MFQKLPILVIYKVLEYHYPFLPSVGSKRWKALSPLLWSCQCWRQVVLSELLKEHSVSADSEKISRRTTNWPTHLDHPASFNAAPWAKIVNVHVCFPITIPSGYFDECQVLDNTRLLVFDMQYDRHSEKVDPDISNIEQLVQYLLKIAPNIDQIRLREGHMVRWVLLNSYAPWACHFASGLANQMASRKLDIASVFLRSEKFNLDINNNLLSQKHLTYINIGAYSSPNAIQLVRNCAPTLQVLKLCLEGLYKTCLEIISDGMVYPKLEYLKFQYYHQPDTEPRSFPDVVPFPRLRQLELPNYYLFADDVVFRGNQQTLVSVKLSLDSELYSYQQRYPVFTPTSHPNLQQVTLYIPRFESLEDNPSDEFFKLLSDLPKKVQELDFKSVAQNDIKNSVNILPVIHDFHHLRILRLSALSIGFIEAVELISRCPYLTELQCQFLPMKKPSKRQSHDEYLSQMVNTHFPLGPRLRTLHVVIRSRKINQSNVRTTMALSILCPNIQHMIMEPELNRCNFEEQWKRLLAQPGYKGYARRLGSIRFAKAE